jgi:hypothetical protein
MLSLLVSTFFYIVFLFAYHMQAHPL